MTKRSRPLAGSRIAALCAVLLAHAAPEARAQLLPDELERLGAVEAFLSRSRIVGSERLDRSRGVTRPYRLTLDDGTGTRHALWKSPEGWVRGYWESWRYEIAAYRLDRLLGLGMVPPTVERLFRTERGSCQAWVDHWIDGVEMKERSLQVPATRADDWSRAVGLQRAFDYLIANEDRHLGNLLITEDWRLILIDHSRAFRAGPWDRSDGTVLRLESLPPGFVRRLRALDGATLRRETAGLLSRKEIRALLERRDRLLETAGAESERPGKHGSPP